LRTERKEKIIACTIPRAGEEEGIDHFRSWTKKAKHAEKGFHEEVVHYDPTDRYLRGRRGNAWFTSCKGKEGDFLVGGNAKTARLTP